MGRQEVTGTMPTSLRGPLEAHPNRPVAGFTLVEILVVVSIVSIVLAVASVNLLPDDRRTLADEAERLALLFELAGDAAASQGGSFAWQATGKRHAFYRRNSEEQWSSDVGDELLRPRDWPDGVRLESLDINHVQAAPDERLVFTASGAAIPFAVTLALGKERVCVLGNALGRVAIVDPAHRYSQREQRTQPTASVC